MGSVAASLDRLCQSVTALESAGAAVSARVAALSSPTDPASVERHARLRSEVAAAIAELDHLIGVGNR